MRKRIQQLAAGKFEYARPILQLSTEKVDIEVLEGKDYTGDFVITSANRVPMRGVIYSSDPRMECLTPQFEGEEVRIRYQFHSGGFTEGDIRKGDFFIVCNQGEYNLSFVVSVSRLYADSSVGKIKNLNDFTRLAKADFGEACRLFYTKNFRNIIKAEEQKELLLYEGLSRGVPLGQKVDEFLIGTHKKKAADITLSCTQAEFLETAESRKESIEIKRDQWGYADIRVYSDAAFLIPSKERIREEDFLGSTCIFEYYIDHRALHAGKNFGRLSFEIPGKTLALSVCVFGGETADKKRQKERRQVKEGRVALLRLYLDYRLKRIVTGVWANRSVELLDHLAALCPREPIYPLMKAQAFLINRQRQEAVWIMDAFKREWKDREAPVWGYYLYLCTLLEREPSYVDRTAEEIELLFRKNPDSTLLFWILLFVKDEYYKNSSKRLHAIERWIKKGNRSPYLYLEAYYLLWQDPYLLGKLDWFETELLNWACRQGAITREIAAQVVRLVPEKKEFHPFVSRILQECYRVYQEDELLAALCGYLIKGQCFGTGFHKWYELGIAHEVRITGLYEAYLMSLDSREILSVPKMIQMYFQYDSKLSYQKKAVLFVNIIAGKASQPEVYQKYKRTIGQFAMEQMEAGHINDNLAVIYDEMLRAGMLNEELAHRLAGILFTHKLTCFSKGVTHAVIFDRRLKEPVRAAFAGGTAYFTVYSTDYRIILEDNCGNCFVNRIPFQDEPLMNPGGYLEKGLSLAPDEPGYILYRFDGKKKAEDFTEEDSRYFNRLLSLKELSESYKAELVPEVIRYYQNTENPLMQRWLKEVEFDMLRPEERRSLTELLVAEHVFEKAYEMAQVYDYAYLESTARVALCSYAITECGFEEDDFLVGFAETTFRKGKYNDVMLIYLCKYYNGPTKVMAELWKAAGEFQIDTFDLEERILTQMLYTTDYIAYVEQIYDSYYAGGGRELLCLAYLSYFSNGYLVRDAVIPGHVFLQVQERYIQEKELNDVCKIALLKHYAKMQELSPRQSLIAEELLKTFIGKNIYFGFYRCFEQRMISKYHLYDKFFLEYHTKPHSHVAIYYRMGEKEYSKEELTEMYDGIFVKEFVLFFGESVQYYIVEEDGVKEKVTESNCIANHDILDKDSTGRYAQMNDMLVQAALQDGEQLKCKMKNYYGMKRVTEEMFELL